MKKLEFLQSFFFLIAWIEKFKLLANWFGFWIILKYFGWIALTACLEKLTFFANQISLRQTWKCLMFNGWCSLHRKKNHFLQTYSVYETTKKSNNKTCLVFRGFFSFFVRPSQPKLGFLWLLLQYLNIFRPLRIKFVLSWLCRPLQCIRVRNTVNSNWRDLKKTNSNRRD